MRCQGKEAAAIGSAPAALPCYDCASLSKHCVWPQEDGRKRAKTSSPGNLRGRDDLPNTYRNENSSPWSFQSMMPLSAPADQRILPTSVLPVANGGAYGKFSLGECSDSSASETPFTTVHYYRHLGPAAVAPCLKMFKASDKGCSMRRCIIRSRRDGGGFDEVQYALRYAAVCYALLTW